MIVILYVMDSLRPDFLSCYGYKKETSPNIDKMAKEGVIFNNAFAQSTWTKPSGASILSSTYPSVHSVITEEDIFSSMPTLPEKLKKNGFKTIAISSMGHISSDFGFDKGFDHFMELYKEKSILEKRKKIQTESVGWQQQFRADYIAISTSEDINEFLFPLLEKYKKRDLFIFIWSLDTHDPYFHRAQKLSKFCSPSKELLWFKDIVKMKSEDERNRLKTLYEDMIYYNDYHIGALTEKLKKLDLYDRTLFIITSDHGEAFGEHGGNGHAGLPYDEQIKVPLIMRFPSSELCGRIEGLVQHIDIFPTILGYLNINEKTNNFIQGKSMLSVIMDRKEINPFVFSETQLDEISTKCISLRNHDYKYIEIEPPKLRLVKSLKSFKKFIITNLSLDRQKLFSLREDPAEQNNVIKFKKSERMELKSIVDSILEHNQKISMKFIKEERKKRKDIDERIKKQLRALGYLK